MMGCSPSRGFKQVEGTPLPTRCGGECGYHHRSLVEAKGDDVSNPRYAATSPSLSVGVSRIAGLLRPSYPPSVTGRTKYVLIQIVLHENGTDACVLSPYILQPNTHATADTNNRKTMIQQKYITHKQKEFHYTHSTQRSMISQYI